MALILFNLVIFAGQIQAADFIDFKPTSTTTYDYQLASTIEVCLNLGYFINVNSASDIEVYQDATHGGNPFMTYYGCGQIDVLTTFPAVIKGTATGTSPAGGHWSVTLNDKPDLAIPIGTSPVVVCVLGTEVQTQLLITSQVQENTPVAVITIQVTPQ
jgi:hypothetical protein